MHDRLNVTSTEHTGCTVLTVTGELDLGSARLLDTALADAAGRHTSMILDLSGVTFMDSSGLHLIARTYRDYGRRRDRLAIVPSQPVARIFELAGALDYFPLCPSLDAALTALRPPIVTLQPIDLSTPPHTSEPARDH